MEKIVIVLLIILLGIYGLKSKKPPISRENGEQMKAKYSKIKAEQAKEIIDSQDVIILDVRTPAEYEEGHIEGALLIPDYDLRASAEGKLPDKDAKILMYCRSGSRSRAAAKALINMGYTDVHDFGGLMSWPYDLVQGK